VPATMDANLAGTAARSSRYNVSSHSMSFVLQYSKPNDARRKLMFHGNTPVSHAPIASSGAPPSVFLLSPANTTAKRGKILCGESARFDLAVRFRQEGASLGEVYSFISGLYFRGKLSYSRAFASPPENLPGVLVMTTSRGLLGPDTRLTRRDLAEMSLVPIDPNESRYHLPLRRDALTLNNQVPPDCRIVLLGSIASAKYVSPLLEVFGTRLLFPIEFVGRGDLSRGGLLLRCVREQRELHYAPVASTNLRGTRPPRLSP